MDRISSAGTLLVTGLFAAVGSLSAQTCSGTQDFSGPYVFTAVRLAYVSQSTNPPGTTAQNPLPFTPQPTNAPGTTGQYSMTPIGQLVGWSSNMAPFSGVGRILADGAGVIYASNKADEPGFTRVGTYTVSLDCTVSVTFTDAFATQSTTPGSGTPSTTANQLPSVTFQGVLTDRGNQATLVQNTQGSGVLLNMVRPFLATGCSNASLGGRYGLSGLGVSLAPQTGTTTSTSPSPLTWALLFTADGAGQIGNPVGTTTGYTGTYSVKSDCTGTLTLKSPGTTSTTQKLAFVLTNSNNSPGQLPRASVLFVLDDPGNFAGFGEAR